MVELATTTPLQDNGIAQAPFQLISSLLATVKSLLGENWPRPPEMNELTESYPWLLLQKDSLLPQTVLEDLLSTLSPLLERQQPSEEMCTAFSRHCQSHPRSFHFHRPADIKTQRGEMDLCHSNGKMTMFIDFGFGLFFVSKDFGKHPYMRRFVQDYIRVLYAHNDGPQAVKEFVRK